MARYTREHKIYLEKISYFFNRKHKIYLAPILEDIIFYNELYFRSEALKALNINNTIESNFYLNNEVSNSEIAKSVTNAKTYIDIIKTYQDLYYDDIKTDSFELLPISLKKLMGLDKKYLISKEQFYIITDNSDSEYSYINSKLYNYIEQEQFVFYEILENIYNYFIDSNEEYEKFSIQEYGRIQECRNRYVEYIDYRIEQIFLNIEEVICYLEKAQVLDNYRDKLIDYFKLNTPISTIKNSRLNADLSTHYYPNKIINYQFNLNDDIEVILDDIKNLYTQFSKQRLLDIDLLYERNSLENIRHESQASRNRSASFTFVDKLFLFDYKFFGFSNDDLRNEFVALPKPPTTQTRIILIK